MADVPSPVDPAAVLRSEKYVVLLALASIVAVAGYLVRTWLSRLEALDAERSTSPTRSVAVDGHG
jgi:hypothetical protein